MAESFDSQRGSDRWTGEVELPAGGPRGRLRQQLRGLSYAAQQQAVAPPEPISTSVQLTASDTGRSAADQQLVSALTGIGIAARDLEGLNSNQLRALDNARQAIAAGDLERADREIRSLEGAVAARLLDEFAYHIARPYFTANPEIWATSEGPEPLLAPPDAGIVRTARLKLLDGEQLSEPEIVALLQQTVHDVRLGQMTAYGSTNAREALSAEVLSGTCGRLSEAVAQRLQALGFDQEQVALHQARVLFGGNTRGANHSFVALRIGNRVFLLDASLRQFFTLGAGDSREIRDRILQEDGGSQLAYDLMTRGYVELDEQSAAAYGIGLGQSETSARTPEQYHTPQPFSQGQRVRYRYQNQTGQAEVRNFRGNEVYLLTDDDDLLWVPVDAVETIERRSDVADPRASTDLARTPLEPLPMPELPDLGQHSLLSRARRSFPGG